MNKYIDAEKLKYEIERRKLSNYYTDTDDYEAELFEIIDSLQQEQPKKYIELNGIKYREVPAKTNDKICKDCDYFLDNGTCELEDCPCIDDNTILERLNEQPEVDLKEEVNKFSEKMPIQEHKNIFEGPYQTLYELGLNAKKEE